MDETTRSLPYITAKTFPYSDFPTKPNPNARPSPLSAEPGRRKAPRPSHPNAYFLLFLLDKKNRIHFSAERIDTKEWWNGAKGKEPSA